MITKDDLFRLRNQYLIERGRTPDENLPMYTDWLEVQLIRKAPEVPEDCDHPFRTVISHGANHHCLKCKTNIKPI